MYPYKLLFLLSEACKVLAHGPEDWSLQMQNTYFLTLASIVLLSACESATDPAAEAQDLSSADAQFLADQMDIMTSSLLDDVLGSSPVEPSQVGTLHHQPRIWNLSLIHI